MRLDGGAYGRFVSGSDLIRGVSAILVHLPIFHKRITRSQSCQVRALVKRYSMLRILGNHTVCDVLVWLRYLTMCVTHPTMKLYQMHERCVVEVMLKHEVKRIKNGWSVRSPELRLAAHGFSQEAAMLNLQSTVRLLLAPFSRDGTLTEEIRMMGLRMSETGGEGISVILE